MPNMTQATSKTAQPTTTAVRPKRSPIVTSKALFFAAAGISFFLSVALWFSGDRERGLFVGLWVPSILAAGSLLLTGMRDE
jgi:hypothetical protein